MTSAFSPPSYLSRGPSDPADLREPFLLQPCWAEPAGGPAPGLLPHAPSSQKATPLRLYRRPFEPASVQKRNERERQRVRCVNQGYAQLRELLPGQNQNRDRRLSKVETLRAAIGYIRYLRGLVDTEGPGTAAGPGAQDPSPGAEPAPEEAHRAHPDLTGR